MTKKVIISSLTGKYDSFIKFINELTKEEYLYSNKGKWGAEQQLEHIVLCVKPLVQVFSMDKEIIGQTFGRTNRESRNYDALLNDYIGKLTEGGKAPDRYEPETTLSNSKEKLTESLVNLIKELCLKIDTFSEQELDSLLIPHPLLKNLTLREMLYNTIYHVEHHQNQIKQNLQKT
jgi:hypothetical protein